MTPNSAHADAAVVTETAQDAALDSTFEPIAGRLRLPLRETIDVLGLSGQDLGDPNTLAIATRRSKDMASVLDRISEWTSSRSSALQWYLDEKIPAIGGNTPQNLVNSGRTTALHLYIDHIAVGGFA